jgi:hypothetical protein
MSKNGKNVETGVTLPENNIIDVEWARKALANVDLFSASLLAYGRGEVMFMLKTNLSEQSYLQALSDLLYTAETAETYIVYLQKRAIIEAIRDKYYIALSVSAAQIIPDSVDDALAICDIVVAKYGKITFDNIKKALESTGKSVQKMSDAAISVEVMKKKALHEWLLDEYGLSDDDIYSAQRLHPEGRTEFTEKMAQAYFLLEDWAAFYKIIADAVHDSNNMKALRFLSDINDASASIQEYLKAEAANRRLIELKLKFDSEIYPELSFTAATVEVA